MFGNTRSSVLTVSLLIAVCISFASPALSQEKGKKEIETSGGGERAISVIVPSDGSGFVYPSDLNTQESDLATAQVAEGCNWWWVNGWDSWKYNYYLLYLHTRFNSNTSTTYGTSAGSCGIPLTVDRLYLHATEYPLGSVYGTFEKTGYTTNYIEKEDVRDLFGSVPLPCGIKGFHEATHHGVTWSVTISVGCAP